MKDLNYPLLLFYLLCLAVSLSIISDCFLFFSAREFTLTSQIGSSAEGVFPIYLTMRDSMGGSCNEALVHYTMNSDQLM